MVIFHSYVSLPEGIIGWYKHQYLAGGSCNPSHDSGLVEKTHTRLICLVWGCLKKILKANSIPGPMFDPHFTILWATPNQFVWLRRYSNLEPIPKEPLSSYFHSSISHLHWSKGICVGNPGNPMFDGKNVFPDVSREFSKLKIHWQTKDIPVFHG